MISNIMISTGNLTKAEVFFDALLGLFGAKKTIQNKSKILWKCRNDDVGLIVYQQDKQLPRYNADSSIVVLHANSPSEAAMIYQVALRLGATGKCEPTVGAINEHEASFFDSDNNKFSISCK